MGWQDEFKRKLTTPEEAVKVVKSGDRLYFTRGNEPIALSMALLARASELRNVKIYLPTPGRDLGWYDPGFEDSFQIEVGYILPVVRQMMVERRCDYRVGPLHAAEKWEQDEIDVLFTQLSPPDQHGYCSFGASLWDKKQKVLQARVVLAEINANLIRTYGENYVHVSDIDYFVEHTPTGRTPGATDLLGRKTTGPGEIEKRIAEHIGTLIKDGDTMEIGVGAAAEWVARLGILDSRHDLGWHSENTPLGVLKLAREGVVTGRCKTINTGKLVATAVGGGTKEDMDWVDGNPMCELHPAHYILDPCVISAHDNMVAINAALAVDLTGQIASESLGPQMYSGTGGQLAFAIGAQLSKGGRSIEALPSTAKNGTISRITPMLEPGSVVTVPRTLADIVVTEYGIARLRGRTQRERAEALIAIAHPDFRAELKKAAQRLFWP